MIFTPENAAKVVAGTKTQTRRPEKWGDESIIYFREIAAVKRNGRFLWRVNNGTIDWLSLAGVGKNDGSRGGGAAEYRQPTYSVQPGRGKQGLDRFRILKIRHEALLSINQEDAEAEGFGSPGEFLTEWQDLYDMSMVECLNEWVWALTLSLVPKEWGLGGSR